MLKSVSRLILLPLIFLGPELYSDVNVLIIGNEKSIQNDAQALKPSQLKTELEKILKGAKLGKVNVVFEETYKEAKVQRKSWILKEGAKQGSRNKNDYKQITRPVTLSINNNLA